MPRLIAGLLFTILFAAAAFVQRNDADPEQWIGIYAVAGFLSLLFAFGVLPRWLAWMAAVAAFGWAGGVIATVWPPSADWRPDDQFLSEEVREAGGLTLIGLWLFIAGVIGRKRAKSS